MSQKGVINCGSEGLFTRAVAIGAEKTSQIAISSLGRHQWMDSWRRIEPEEGVIALDNDLCRCGGKSITW